MALTLLKNRMRTVSKQARLVGTFTTIGLLISGCGSQSTGAPATRRVGGSDPLSTGGQNSTADMASGGDNGTVDSLATTATTGGTAATGGSTTAGGTSSAATTATTGGTAAPGGSTTAGGTSSTATTIITTAAAGSTTAGGTSSTAGNGTENLFETLIGKSTAEVDSKVTTAVHLFFGIGTGEATQPSRDTGYRCYYELPQSPTMGFIWAADSNDIRSEGMSYGMMIAVQTDLRTQFDKLWTFARTYMQYPADTSTAAWRYYFRWQGTVDATSSSSWTVLFEPTQAPAPDGDEYFAAALYLADQRWGSSGTVNYKQEADNIATAMLHNTASGDGRYPIVHTSQNMVVFVPLYVYNDFTDPSYHLPAFYELFALYGPTADSARWKALATTSRNFLVSSANGTTGLHPDYATFAGAPRTGRSGDGHDRFQYDAWRVVLNMAVDFAWFSGDAKMKTQVEKYHSFFTSYLGTNDVTQSLFAVDGSDPWGGGSTALTATLAAGSLASGASNRAAYVKNLWDAVQQSGTYRYYQEGVYLLGLLAVSGKYRYAW